MSGRSRFPFTASQWQELEHQALIFKYIASGIPVPPDLLFAIKRSYLDSSMPSRLFPNHHPQHVRWNCFQMGLGRKIDPEPGRCRRTDGKKWRCSKEAFPDSKYCERHMHRGKNRSRKPVEVLKSPGSASNPISSQTPNSTSLSSLSSVAQNRHNLQYHCYNNTHDIDHHHNHHHHPLVYHHHYSSSSSSRTHLGMIGLSSQDSNTSMLFDCDLRNRHVYGLKEEADHERAFFSEEPSGTVRGFSGGASSMEDSWQLTPVLTMSCSSSSSSKQRGTCSGLQSEHSYLQLQSASRDAHKQEEQGHDQQYLKLERREVTQKTIHFFDEWPVKEKDSWLDLDDKSSNNSGSVSTTQLSISIPSTNNSSYDFPIFSSRTHNGD